MGKQKQMPARKIILICALVFAIVLFVIDFSPMIGVYVIAEEEYLEAIRPVVLIAEVLTFVIYLLYFAVGLIKKDKMDFFDLLLGVLTISTAIDATNNYFEYSARFIIPFALAALTVIKLIRFNRPQTIKWKVPYIVHIGSLAFALLALALYLWLGVDEIFFDHFYLMHFVYGILLAYACCGMTGIAFLSGINLKSNFIKKIWDVCAVVLFSFALSTSYILRSYYNSEFVWVSYVAFFFVISVVELINALFMKKTEKNTVEQQAEPLTDTESQEKRETQETPQAQESEPQE